jgi:hypothetical protein
MTFDGVTNNTQNLIVYEYLKMKEVAFVTPKANRWHRLKTLGGGGQRPDLPPPPSSSTTPLSPSSAPTRLPSMKYKRHSDLRPTPPHSARSARPTPPPPRSARSARSTPPPYPKPYERRSNQIYSTTLNPTSVAPTCTKPHTSASDQTCRIRPRHRTEASHNHNLVQSSNQYPLY